MIWALRFAAPIMTANLDQILCVAVLVERVTKPCFDWVTKAPRKVSNLLRFKGNYTT